MAKNPKSNGKATESDILTITDAHEEEETNVETDEELSVPVDTDTQTVNTIEKDWNPIGQTVMVRQTPVIKKIGSIHLPSSAYEKLLTGTVLKVGDVSVDRLCKWTQEYADSLIGKVVMWHSFAGELLSKSDDGDMLRLSLDDLVMTKVENEEDWVGHE